MNQIFGVFLRTREGNIVLCASIVYLIVGLLYRLVPSLNQSLGFIGLIAIYMPFFLFLTFLKAGGFRKGFSSSWFNTVALIVVALIPVITVVRSAFSH